jgi:2-dehydropantoate 2-reductase
VKIAVIGAGAIGCLVAGYLKLKGENVSLVGRPDTVAEIRKHSLRITGARGDFKIAIDANERLYEKPDFAILAVKTQDLSQAIGTNLDLLKDSRIITIQNGVRADDIAAGYIPKENIISSIVMFGATYLELGHVVHNFEGAWVIGRMFASYPDEVEISESMILDKAFPTVISQDIKGMKYLKIFVNANNCLPAILGVSMQEAFADLKVSRVSLAIWEEGFEIISKAGLFLVSLPGFPVENVTKLLGIPSSEAAKIFSGIMVKLSKDPLYGSILQSIKRERVSEIDYINGEFVYLARQQNAHAPLNKKLVEMVHEVEKTKRFFTKEELLAQVKEFIND